VSPCEVGTLFLARAGKHETWSLSALEAKKYDSAKKAKNALAKIKPKQKAQYCAVPFEIIPEPPAKKRKLHITKEAAIKHAEALISFIKQP
jgi:hypothetical protein